MSIRIDLLPYLFSSVFAVGLIMLRPINMNAQVGVTGLRTDGSIAHMGIGSTKPNFSWELSSTVLNVKQVSYKIKVDQLHTGKKITTI